MMGAIDPSSDLDRPCSVAAVVLAAGLSRRMGRPKMILPWGKTTVIGRVVQALVEAGLTQIVVVTGGAKNEVEHALAGLPVQMAFNPQYANEAMVVSLQVGLRSLSQDTQAALVVLGDQPQIEMRVVQSILNAFQARGACMVVPSYQMRRGHPWLVARSLWPAVFALQAPATLRTLFSAYQQQIEYLPVDTDSILQDLDYPQDYERQKPGGASGHTG